KDLHVWDLTAGLARDAYVLAHLGCSVTLLERSPIIAALLRDGLIRAELAGNATVKKLHLIEQDASQFLQTTTEKPEVIYLDPMFTDLDNSALVKKEMRILRKLVGDDLDAGSLLEQALSFNCKRVVVKRARLAPTLTEIKPSYQLMGKSTRFDVYMGSSS
ncbi:MAG TPA: class I SAM-dependent methyltransferase, partial [Coxiellaceae bacterium]|nr:class I SAM-dependent methyltransferase [Coxiellaceae bacterium]